MDSFRWAVTSHYFFSVPQMEGFAMNNRYGCFNFLLDLVLIGLTSGLWLIWIIYREIRNNRRQYR